MRHQATKTTKHDETITSRLCQEAGGKRLRKDTKDAGAFRYRWQGRKCPRWLLESSRHEDSRQPGTCPPAQAKTCSTLPYCVLAECLACKGFRVRRDPSTSCYSDRLLPSGMSTPRDSNTREGCSRRLLFPRSWLATRQLASVSLALPEMLNKLLWLPVMTCPSPGEQSSRQGHVGMLTRCILCWDKGAGSRLKPLLRISQCLILGETKQQRGRKKGLPHLIFFQAAHV